MFSPLTQELISALRHLPGVGPKTAQRMAYHLLHESNRNKGSLLARVLQRSLLEVKHCAKCRLYTEQALCTLCMHPKRDAGLLCIVESPADVSAFEQAASYFGLYYVLHGHLSPMDGIGAQEIGIPQLLERLQQESIREVIIATNSTMEGEATAYFIASQLSARAIKCSRIAQGVPMGGELEYLDSTTLGHALQSRLPLEIK